MLFHCKLAPILLRKFNVTYSEERGNKDFTQCNILGLHNSPGLAAGAHFIKGISLFMLCKISGSCECSVDISGGAQAG